MAVDVKFLKQIKYGAEVFGVEKTISCEQVITYEESIPNASTDLVKNISDIQLTNMILFAISSDQTILVEYNDDAGTQGSFSLIANVPIVWALACSQELNPVAATITSLYVTNTSGSAASLKIVAGYTI